MTENINKKSVLEFYDKFKQNNHIPAEGTQASLSEEVIPAVRLDLKAALIVEECFELMGAIYGAAVEEYMTEAWKEAKKLDDGTRDIVEAADATNDLRYVIEGFDIETAIPSEKIFAEIHLSNLSKLDENGDPILSDGTDGKPFGKILKGKNYFDPDLKAIIEGRTPDRTPKAIKEALANNA